MRRSRWIKTAIVISAATLTASCQKGKLPGAAKEDGGGSSEETPADPEGGVVENTGNDLVITGVLALSQALTADEKRDILLFAVAGNGELLDDPVSIATDDKGAFKVPIVRQSEKARKIAAAFRDDGSIDRDLLKEVFPEYATDIDAASDADLKHHLGELIEAMKRTRYLLISYVKSGDRVAEAASFQFIGLPAGHGNMIVLPADALKGDANLGEIKGEGDEATAKLKAADTFNLDASQIDELASIGQVLKVLKNEWMNPEEKIRIDPWFGFTSDNLAGAKDAFLVPSSLRPMGGGFYMKPMDIGATWADVCPPNPGVPNDTSGTPYTATPAKRLEFFPPQEVVTSSGTFGPSKGFTNISSTYNRQEQYGEVSCSGDGMYTRGRADTDKSFQLSLGQGFDGAPPQGTWKLAVDGQVIGHWDLGIATPTDADGNPTVYMPAYKVITEGGVAKQIQAKFYFFDRGAGEFREVANAKVLEEALHQLGMDGSYQGDHPGGDLHISGENTTFANGVWTATLPEQDQAPFGCAGLAPDALCLRSIAMSYFIGPVSYRLELREGGN